VRYHVALGGRTYRVDVEGDRVAVDGREVDVDLARREGSPVRHLVLDGASWTVVAEPGAERGRWRLTLSGLSTVEAEVVDERTRAIRAMTGATGAPRGPEPLKAPMPGLIVRVEVAEGEAVEAGAAVVVMEAMKMQNELRSQARGVVRRILVEPGAAVERGTTLVEFDEADG
jgi:biotin carboxyl carrier protein